MSRYEIVLRHWAPGTGFTHSETIDWLEEVKKVFYSGDTYAQPLTIEQLSEPVTSYDNTSIYEEVIK